MDRKIFFCKSWFAAKRMPTEVWTESQAREAHQNGQRYTVLLDSIERPYCVVDVTGDFVAVNFLDEQLRSALTYHFEAVSSGKMFLTMAVHREFDASADRPLSGTTYIFAEDGTLQIRREAFVPEHKLETAKSQTDVSGNYVAAPKFGEYDEFIRVER
jgi:hypothetical protein